MAVRTQSGIEKVAETICARMFADLERAKRPVISATKCSLDNAVYNPKVGF